MMALVHDMAESIVGDITPLDGVSKGPLPLKYE
jgi:5'-deoxynucleotidase YfbR-like HD superfamily hydrolase